MKKNIHPPYHPNAEIRCACGARFTVGATKEKLEVEICKECHPVYTGSEQLLDIAGRAERFKARRTRATQAQPRKKTEKKAAKSERKKQRNK